MTAIYQNKITTGLAQIILDALDNQFEGHGQSIETIQKSFSPAPDIKKGHLAYPCFPLAKTCRKAPVQIANDLETPIKEKAGQLITELKTEGPYINFFFSSKAMGEICQEMIGGNYFDQKLIDTDEKWMTEYSQPNTHKVLHVGHMRNLCLGNALIRMTRYSGINMLAVTYPGDVGTHVAKCLWYLNKHVEKPWPSENRGKWLGEIYVKSNSILEEEKGTEKEDENRKELTTILQQLHAGEGEFFDIWQQTREWSLDMMKSVYEWADVEFDRWFF